VAAAGDRGHDAGVNRRLGYARLTYAAGLTLAGLWAFAILLAGWTTGTLGYDYRAYDLAVERLLGGQPLYDLQAELFGPFGVYFYPPPFALLMVPFASLPINLGILAWTALLVVASVAAIWFMPVSTTVRWAVLLLAALSWPLVYAIKLGQVGPILLLLFAIGWRWLDRAVPFGAAAGVGTIIKLQPALLIGWALVTGRRRAAVVAILVFTVLSVLATAVTGLGAWQDLVTLLARVSKPITTPQAFGPGRLAFEAGVPESLAYLVYLANLVAVAGITVFATLRASAAASYMAVVIATQFASPVLWDHYALVLLLPTAYLLARGQWWAAAIPLATSTIGSAIGIGVGWAYPLAFWAALLGVTIVGLREARESTPPLGSLASEPPVASSEPAAEAPEPAASSEAAAASSGSAVASSGSTAEAPEPANPPPLLTT
jgi:alpha-1,2-mannosyltransferase